MKQARANIADVKAILDYGEYPCSLQFFPGTTAQQVMIAPVKYLSSPMATSEIARTLVGSLVFMNDLLQSLGQGINPELDALQCLITLPILAPKARQAEFFRLMVGINTEARLGGFGLNVDGALYYRYNWQVYQRNLQGLTLLAILDQAYAIVRQHGYRFEELGSD